jgi:transcriptional regulator with XRE-family HTH domain
MRCAALIREARRRAGLSQRELADRVGTTQSAIARWETGRSAPSLASLERLVRACGLELRLGLAEPDPSEASLIERNLALDPEARLDQLTRTVAFLRAGRAAIEGRRG